MLDADPKLCPHGCVASICLISHPCPQARFSLVMTRQVILSEAGLAETKGRAPLLRVSLNRHRVSCLEPESAMKEAVAFLCVSPVLPPFACVVLYALGNLVFFSPFLLLLQRSPAVRLLPACNTEFIPMSFLQDVSWNKSGAAAPFLSIL